MYFVYLHIENIHILHCYIFCVFAHQEYTYFGCLCIDKHNLSVLNLQGYLIFICSRYKWAFVSSSYGAKAEPTRHHNHDNLRAVKIRHNL